MPKRILLADDSITIQKVVELTFSDGDYEVTAVNNGTKAIQKLSEMRPDIILSDIIMPEKNGYEVCEFVKSHPEFRGIPVVLLTGTFEPFDPDRADKAGCDAVVTKPFESQSLIHKVEELIANARASAPAAAAAAPAPEPPPPAAAPPSAESFFSEPPPPPADNFSTSAFESQGSDVFGSAPAAAPMDTPFDAPATGGETKAFPRMSFDDLQKMANEPPLAATPSTPTPPPMAPAAHEASPWDEPAVGGETKAFGKMTFEDLQKMANEPPMASAPPPPPPPPAAPEASPWDEGPAIGGETKAFGKMTFEDLRAMAESAPPTPPPSMTPFESPAAPPPAPAQEASSPWDEAPAPIGETKTFPKMDFDDLQKMETSPAPTPAPVPPQPPTLEAPAPAAAAEAPVSTGPVGDLTEEQVDRIARRVVQLMSEQVIKNIAWEVIPDMAEMVVKERIRQLESEA